MVFWFGGGGRLLHDIGTGAQGSSSDNSNYVTCGNKLEVGEYLHNKLLSTKRN